jgi:hypothetical protein
MVSKYDVKLLILSHKITATDGREAFEATHITTGENYEEICQF